MVPLRLFQIWHLNGDPTDAAAPYTPYSFTSGNMQLDVGIARRQSVTTIPGVDGVADGYGSRSGPLDDRILTYTCLVPTAGGPEAARDRLMAALMGTRKVRLVALADDNVTLWFTTGKLIRLDLVLDAEQAFRFTFKAQWRIRPDWRLEFSESAQVFRTGTVFAAGTTFGSLGTTVVNIDPKTFTIDATGVAGISLPTLPDRGPKITLHGPLGGTAGFLVANNTATTIDPSGAEVPSYFIVPFKLPTAADTAILNFAAQTFTGDGVPFRPTKPAFQSEYFRIDPGVVNQCAIGALGTSIVTGGSISIDWYKKRG